MESPGNGYILVVDDAAFMRRMLVRLVQSFGYEVLEAEDGASAILAMRKEPPVLVILDLMMPQITGSQVCAWIRNNKPTAHIPVIVCTANQERKFLEKAIKAGASDIL